MLSKLTACRNAVSERNLIFSFRLSSFVRILCIVLVAHDADRMNECRSTSVAKFVKNQF